MCEDGGVPAIHDAGFSAEVSLAGPVALTLRGNADSTTSSALVALVHRLHQAVIEQRASSVLIDISQLEFMNASSFNVFVDWLTLVRELPVGGRYVLRFRSSARLPWQERSLQTLACFASQLVVVEE